MKGVQKEKNRDNKGKIHFTFKGVRLGGCLFLFYILSCTGKGVDAAAYSKIGEVKCVLKSGDIIVRNGTDEVSNTARSFNRRDKTYSHCGIIQVEKDSIWVYHALGGSYNPSQKLLRQPLELFCDPEETDKFAVFRYELTPKEAVHLSHWVLERYIEGLPFDLFFNFYTDDKMYCSEFVFKALNAARGGALSRYLHRDGDVLYVSIDDLYLNENAKEIVTKVF